MATVRAHSTLTTQAVKLLGVYIQLARKQRRWSEQALAERAGISRATLQKIESGHLGVAVGLVFEIAVLVGVPLFANDGQPLSQQLDQAKHTIMLLPQRIQSKPQVVDDDF